MKSNAPWSVKGIERDVRETAKEAARREGMTVGEWLNHVITEAGDPNAATTGEIDGLALRDVATAIEHLSARVASAEKKSLGAVDELARSFGGVVERVQRLERGRSEGADAGAVAERLAALEENASDRQRIEALKALEKAVGQIALQFDSSQRTVIARLDANERQVQELASRIDGIGDSNSDVGSDTAAFLKDAIDGMSARVARAERIASEAARIRSEASDSVDADFVERTGQRLRVLGDEIKRGGDQMRALETAITKLSGQIDAAERRSADGVQKVSETIADLRQQLVGADAAESRDEMDAVVAQLTERTEARIGDLQRSFEKILTRLEQTAATAAPPAEPAPAPTLSVAAAPLAATTEDDLQKELDEAFASIDLDFDETPPNEPAPASPVRAADVAEPEMAPDEVVSADSDDAGDDFDFDFDDFDDNASKAAASESDTTEADDASDFDDVLAALDRFADDEGDEADAPPMVDEPPSPFGKRPAAAAVIENDDFEEAPTATPTQSADYLKAARAAAREAAAKAALEAEPGEESGKRQLTPKQRAILAARIKRKRLEAERAAAEAEERAAEFVAEPASPERPQTDETDAPRKSPLSAVAAIAAGAVARLPFVGKKNTEEAVEEAPPSLRSRIAEDRKQPVRPIFIMIGVGVLLAGAALVFTMRDKSAVTRGGAPAEAASDTPEVDTPLRPRDLYFDGMSSLADATTDGQERAALRTLEEAAALGHPPAQLQLGEMYKSGQGVERDLDQAKVWYERAANGGNVLAMHRLGVMAARGEGGPVEPARSIEWFEKAATLGLVDAQFNLGTTYHPNSDGATVFQDREKAFFWYTLAARNGDTQAAELAAGVGEPLTAEVRARIEAEAAAWAPQEISEEANERAAL